MPRPLFFAAFVLLAAQAAAAPVTFIFQGSGAGSIGGVAFGMTSFTVTAHADTANRQLVEDVFVLDHDSAQIAIEGVGVFAFTSGTRTFVAPGSELVGFTREFTGEFTSGDLIYAPFDAAAATWELTTSMAIPSGPGTVLQWADSPPVTTSGGALIFADATPSVAFQAIVVPEPAAGWAAVAGLCVAGVVARARHRDWRRLASGIHPVVRADATTG